MHDSGKRKTTETGAQSDPSHANAAMELLSPYSLWQLSTWLGKGAEKYAPRNWEKGIPFSVCLGKLKRHLAEYEMGKTDEPHLDAVGFWWHALTHYEAMIKLGKLPTSLNDLPMYEKQREDIESEEVGKFTIKKAQDNNNNNKGWYIILTRAVGCCYSGPMFLHKELEICRTTGWHPYSGYGEAPGYYSNKEEAKIYITAYENKSFVVPEGWKIELFNPFLSEENECGWCVQNKETRNHLHKSFILRAGTGWLPGHTFGEAPGYWPTKEAAEDALKQYLAREKS